MSSEELAAAYPDLDFTVYFRAMGINPQDKLVVGQPSYFSALDKMFASENIEVMKNYMLGQLVQGRLDVVEFYLILVELQHRLHAHFRSNSLYIISESSYIVKINPAQTA